MLDSELLMKSVGRFDSELLMSAMSEIIVQVVSCVTTERNEASDSIIKFIVTPRNCTFRFFPRL